jgi:hypothetical protein
MKKTLLILFAAVAAFPLFAQVEIGGVSVPSNLKVGDKILELNGAGIRKKAIFEIYVGALYLNNKSKDGTVLAKANEAMASRLTITSGMVTSDKMYEATLEGFKKSTGGNMAPIQSSIDKFVALFKKEAITKGDVFLMLYTPNVGVTVSKNGKVLETIAGLDFKTALFGMWLGNDPVDAGLKNGMLGIK